MKKSGASGEVCPVCCDLRRESDIMDMFQLIRSKYGRLDVCINNAGVLSMNTLTDGTIEEWREMLDVGYVQYTGWARKTTQLPKRFLSTACIFFLF